MIKKIFYSIVLFPELNYTSIINWFKISQIIEYEFGCILVIFFDWIKYEEVYFKYYDFLDIEFRSKLNWEKWYIYWKNKDLVLNINLLLGKSIFFDFNFFKPKEFYFDKPFWTVLNITSKCNLFCDYCFNDYDYPLDTRNSRKTLWLEDFKKIIDELYESWTRDIILTWWEPFSCTFLWELLEYLKNKKIFVRINTNWTLLTDSNLKRLNNNYSIHLMISMHEFNNNDYFIINKAWASKIYWITNLKNWENKYDDKIKQLKKISGFKNITYDFLTILNPKNIVYLEKIYSYILNNFKIEDWHFFRLFSTWTTKWISKEMITLAIHKIYKLNKMYGKSFKIVDAVPFCVTKNIDIASKVIDWELSKNHNVKTIITAEWNVQIMSAFDSHLWNIFKNSITKIWSSDFVQRKLTNKFLPKECNDCFYKDECMWWSRMDANIYNWSYWALDPLADLNNKKIWI